MRHACTTCGHSADSHEPWCDDEIESLWGKETCGCTAFEAEPDE